MKRRTISLLLAAVLLTAPAQAIDYQAGGIRDAVREIPLPIIMYHHISENPAQLGKYVITPQELEQDLIWLRDNGWHSISVQQLLDWYDGTFVMPEKPCMITFDDGYESTLVYAEPLLAQYGFTGVTAIIGSICQQYTQQPDHNLAYSHLDWQAAAAMSQRGVLEVQYHSWDMHHLSPRKGCSRQPGEAECCYRQALERDLEQFRAGCEANGVRLIPSVAYPFGAFSSETEAFFRQAGFQAAFTCQEQTNRLMGDPSELWSLGRYNRPHGVPIQTFFG